jgi:hypothetical protein
MAFQRKGVGLRIRPSGKYIEAISMQNINPNSNALNLEDVTFEWKKSGHLD